MDPEVLREAGWYEGRSADLSVDESAMRLAGYGLTEAAARFFGELSGLEFRIVRHGRPDSIWFDARRAMSWATPETVAAYERQLEGRLAPIGYAYHDHLLLMITEDGRLIGAYDDYVVDLGSSPVEAITKLATQDLVH